MKEIGGYLGLEEFSGSEYHDNVYRVNLGRTALIYLLENLPCRRLYVPLLLCDSMTAMCEKHGIVLSDYRQTPDFLPLLETPLEKDSWLLLVNYHGQLTDHKILSAKAKWDRVIVDHTHSFYQKPLPGIPTLYSCRKYFGLPDGAYLSTDLALPPLSGQDISYPRMGHLLGRYEETASAHYGELHTTASSYYEAVPLSMSRLTRNLLRAIDYEKTKAQRNANYLVLEEALGSSNPLSPAYAGPRQEALPLPFTMPDGPLAYPFFFSDGPALRKALAKRQIYVPTYWGNVIEKAAPHTLEFQCAANVLALPCDHRYGAKEMLQVAQAVLELTA